jgi:hypothetical protein
MESQLKERKDNFPLRSAQSQCGDVANGGQWSINVILFKDCVMLIVTSNGRIGTWVTLFTLLFFFFFFFFIHSFIHSFILSFFLSFLSFFFFFLSFFEILLIEGRS